MELLLQLEQNFNLRIKIDDIDLEDLRTLARIARLVANQGGARKRRWDSIVAWRHGVSAPLRSRRNTLSNEPPSAVTCTTSLTPGIQIVEIPQLIADSTMTRTCGSNPIQLRRPWPERTRDRCAPIRVV